ncbi:unnamed protein product [Rhizophagus irregularis]|uniref:Uncharacterized protein n=1 Tax=Rhizophagus irregularis TaxID=588596 RepID=A0A916DWH1_9GLOM|nr:unnamed protein product [Rhizophagus irregularis]CAB5295435.1 unnamed protein product [Rhizophagus irregularis]
MSALPRSSKDVQKWIIIINLFWICILASSLQNTTLLVGLKLQTLRSIMPYSRDVLIFGLVFWRFLYKSRRIALLERLRMLFLAGSGSALPDVVGVVGGSVVLKKL